MSRRESTAFLQWAVPRLGLRWAGFRNVRGQVEKRVGRRVAELALPDLAAYRARLQADPAEWEVLRGLCGVTISRFYRDRRVWDAIIDEVRTSLCSERQGRLIDHDESGSMEQKKREGYF